MMPGRVIAPVICPKCGQESEGVYMRDADLDDLVCAVCRSGETTGVGALLDGPDVASANSLPEGRL